jgi:hypothetical protein
MSFLAEASALHVASAVPDTNSFLAIDGRGNTNAGLRAFSCSPFVAYNLPIL